MIQSETLGDLASALVAAQGEFEAVAKTADNPFFRSKYADLPSVVKAATPILVAHGLAVTQMLGIDTLTTMLLHESGEYIGDEAILHLARQVKDQGWVDASDPQAQGSAITYMRRYAYMAILGLVADEDDDGNAASRPSEPPATIRREAPVRPAAATQARTALTTAVDPSKITEKQLKLVSVLFGKKGFPDDRSVRHEYVKLIVGHEIGSSKELSKQDASKLIDALNAEPEPGEPQYAEGEETF